MSLRLATNNENCRCDDSFRQALLRCGPGTLAWGGTEFHGTSAGHVQRAPTRGTFIFEAAKYLTRIDRMNMMQALLKALFPVPCILYIPVDYFSLYLLGVSVLLSSEISFFHEDFLL